MAEIFEKCVEDSVAELIFENIELKKENVRLESENKRLKELLKLINNQKDLDPEFSKVVDKHFFDLI